MRDVTLAQTRGPVKPARRAPRDAGERAGPPARHASGSLREPPLASPRAAHRAVERAAGPRREVSDDRAGGAARSPDPDRDTNPRAIRGFRPSMGVLPRPRAPF